MSQERNLGAVIDEILVAAPDLADFFSSLVSSIRYSPPEMMRSRWNEAAEILNSYAAAHPKRERIAAIFYGAPAAPAPARGTTPRTDAVASGLVGAPFKNGKHPLVDLARKLERELSSAQEQIAALREAEEILSWLERMHVEVRKPALYGSFLAFKAFTTEGDEGCEDGPSDLRAQARAALAATRKESEHG